MSRFSHDTWRCFDCGAENSLHVDPCGRCGKSHLPAAPAVSAPSPTTPGPTTPQPMTAGMVEAMEAFQEWRKLDSWAHGADDHKSNQKAWDARQAFELKMGEVTNAHFTAKLVAGDTVDPTPEVVPSPASPVPPAQAPGEQADAIRLLRAYVETESTRDREPNCVTAKQEAENVLERFESWLESTPRHTPDELKKWWAAKCPECGWRGLDRDCAVPGTSDPLCPVCLSKGKRVVVDDDKPGVPEDVVRWLKILLETDFTFRNMMPKESEQLSRLLGAANSLALWVEKTFAIKGIGGPIPKPQAQPIPPEAGTT